MGYSASQQGEGTQKIKRRSRLSRYLLNAPWDILGKYASSERRYFEAKDERNCLSFAKKYETKPFHYLWHGVLLDHR